MVDIWKVNHLPDDCWFLKDPIRTISSPAIEKLRASFEFELIGKPNELNEQIINKDGHTNRSQLTSVVLKD